MTSYWAYWFVLTVSFRRPCQGLPRGGSGALVSRWVSSWSAVWNRWEGGKQLTHDQNNGMLDLWCAALPLCKTNHKQVFPLLAVLNNTQCFALLFQTCVYQYTLQRSPPLAVPSPPNVNVNISADWCEQRSPPLAVPSPPNVNVNSSADWCEQRSPPLAVSSPLNVNVSSI